MHPDIEKAINLIDHQITELQRAKRTLIEAFGERTVQVDSKLPLSSLLLQRTKKTKRTRRQAVVKLLQEEGPFTRSEILQKTGIPLGTVSFILNDKTTFRNKDGKWHLAETIKEEKETQQNQTK